MHHPHGEESGRGVAWSAPVWPLNVYGATKCFAEALARVFSSSHGLSCLCVRLGGFGMGAEENVSAGVSGIDCAGVFGACVDAAPSLMFAIVPGMSDNVKNHMDVEDGALVGWAPAEGRAYKLWNGEGVYGGAKLQSILKCGHA